MTIYPIKNAGKNFLYTYVVVPVVRFLVSVLKGEGEGLEDRTTSWLSDTIHCSQIIVCVDLVFMRPFIGS